MFQLLKISIQPFKCIIKVCTFSVFAFKSNYNTSNLNWLNLYVCILCLAQEIKHSQKSLLEAQILMTFKSKRYETMHEKDFSIVQIFYGIYGLLNWHLCTQKNSLSPRMVFMFCEYGYPFSIHKKYSGIPLFIYPCL